MQGLAGWSLGTPLGEGCDVSDTSLGSKERASGRERNLSPCFGRRPRARSLPARTGRASPRGVPGLRPKPSGPGACEGRGPPRRGLTRAARAPAPSPPQRRADWPRRRRAAREGHLSLVAPARPSSSRRATRNVSGVQWRGLSGGAAGLRGRSRSRLPPRRPLPRDSRSDWKGDL